MKDPIPCYVSGKGMFATHPTWVFKTRVIEILESTGLGYDTRYRYYASLFPERPRAELARLVCDPMEYYDPDWPAYRSGPGAAYDETEAATRFMLERDHRFIDEAEVAIVAFDEAGFGSGVNCMRFLTTGRRLLGFYDPERLAPRLNPSNILQLALDYPDLVTLVRQADPGRLEEIVRAWLERTRGRP